MILEKKNEAKKLLLTDPKQEEELRTLETNAELFRSKGDFDKAIVALSEALQVRQSSLQRVRSAGLSVDAEITATVRLLHSFGKVFAEKGDMEKAERVHRDAIRLYEKHRPKKERINV